MELLIKDFSYHLIMMTQWMISVEIPIFSKTLYNVSLTATAQVRLAHLIEGDSCLTNLYSNINESSWEASMSKAFERLND